MNEEDKKVANRNKRWSMGLVGCAFTSFVLSGWFLTEYLGYSEFASGDIVILGYALFFFALGLVSAILVRK